MKKEKIEVTKENLKNICILSKKLKCEKSLIVNLAIERFVEIALEKY